MDWFKDLTGAWDPSGPVYNLWSGFIPCLALLSVFGSVVAHWRHINCHESGCFRISRHEYEFEGAKYKVCRKHHPAVPATLPTAADFAKHHAAQS